MTPRFSRCHLLPEEKIRRKNRNTLSTSRKIEAAIRGAEAHPAGLANQANPATTAAAAGVPAGSRARPLVAIYHLSAGLDIWRCLASP
jgi:hypothetical protein